MEKAEELKTTREKLQLQLQEILQAEREEEIRQAEQARIAAEASELQRQQELAREQEKREEAERIEADRLLEEKLQQQREQEETQLALDCITDQAINHVAYKDVGEDLEALLDLHSNDGPILDLPGEILNNLDTTPLALQDIGRIVEESVTGVLAKDQAKNRTEFPFLLSKSKTGKVSCLNFDN